MTQGNLTLRVEETPLVVQPNPFADGQTVVIPRTDASIQQDPGHGLAVVDNSVSLPEVVAGLNALGVSARDMIDILKSIKAAGALARRVRGAVTAFLLPRILPARPPRAPSDTFGWRTAVQPRIPRTNRDPSAFILPEIFPAERADLTARMPPRSVRRPRHP